MRVCQAHSPPAFVPRPPPSATSCPSLGLPLAHCLRRRPPGTAAGTPGPAAPAGLLPGVGVPSAARSSLMPPIAPATNDVQAPCHQRLFPPRRLLFLYKPHLQRPRRRRRRLTASLSPRGTPGTRDPDLSRAPSFVRCGTETPTRQSGGGFVR